MNNFQFPELDEMPTALLARTFAFFGGTLYVGSSDNTPVPIGGGLESRLGDYKTVVRNVADPDETPITTLNVIRDSDGSESEAYTIFEIKAPEENAREATLALMRTPDPTTGGPEFLDLFHMGYDDARIAGVRIQSRGTGQLVPFEFQFNNGVSGITRTFTVMPDGSVRAHGAIEFYANNARYARIRRVGNNRLAIANDAGTAVIDLFDNGNITLYSEGEININAPTVNINGVPQ